jgi:integrase
MSERSNGRRGLGRIYLRGRVWWIQYSFRGTAIRESSESEREPDAARLLKKRLGEIGRGRLAGPRVERTTFADLERMITDDYAINGRKSAERLESSLKHLRDHFGLCRAVDITGDRLNGYIRVRLEEKPSAKPATVRNELAALKRAFTLAMKAGKVAERPAFPTIAVSNARKGFFEEGDFRSVVALLPDHLKPLAEFARLTGWRKRECLSLEWRQVDLDAGWVRLEPGTTKNDEGRAFPLRAFPELDALLRRERERTDAAEVATGRIIPWVFHHRHGKPIDDFRDSWAKACKAAGVPGLLFHDLRRTAVRNLERAGVSRSAAMKLTGHKTESVYRRYAIVAESDLQEAVGKLAQHHKAVVAQAIAAQAERRKVIPFSGGVPREQAQNDHNFRGEAGSASEGVGSKSLKVLVPEVGLEPTRAEARGILSPVRLPVSPLGRALAGG